MLFSADRLAMADECFVAVAGTRIVGAVYVIFDIGGCAELSTEYVLKEFQGRGIGTKLTRAAVERLVTLGHTPVYINVASAAMDRTLDRLPKRLRRQLRLNRTYKKVGEVELPYR
jgi:GNAT superfamily N-acetyltransferase